MSRELGAIQLQTLSLVLVSRRSTCLTACFRSSPLARERPLPMAWIANDPRSDNPEGGIGQRQGSLGMHVLAKYVVDVCQDHFVVEHGVYCLVLAGQCWRSYPRSRATPRSYEGMAKGATIYASSECVAWSPTGRGDGHYRPWDRGAQ